jgi:crotonobetainyl-CoA:carnitine CoA-transferase CaiB-like acyl-CoA transferase
LSDSRFSAIASLNAATEQQGDFMSAPSRRPEIRRRRTRAEKVAKLRKRLAAASASNDKDRLTAKLHRAGLVSPGNPLVESA